MFKLTILLSLSVSFLSGCGGECSTDQEYSAQLTIVDKQSGESYFKTGSKDRNVDSLQFFIGSLATPSVSIQPYVMPNGGIYFGFIELLNVASETCYLRFNSTDIDTLLIKSRITPFNGPQQCQFYQHETKVYYNNQLVKEGSSDNGSIYIQLRK